MSAPRPDPAGRPSDVPLLYSARRGHAPMNGLGPVAAHFALFSEIGLVLLVTVLVGVLGGYWIDQQLGTLPIFVLGGLFIGLVGGALTVYRLIFRFLATYED